MRVQGLFACVKAAQSRAYPSPAAEDLHHYCEGGRQAKRTPTKALRAGHRKWRAGRPAQA